jgi:hypothetical protein
VAGIGADSDSIACEAERRALVPAELEGLDRNTRPFQKLHTPFDAVATYTISLVPPVVTR